MYFKQNNRFFFIFAFCAVLVSGCGRKQRTLFYFPDKEAVKVNKLDFPAVRGLEAKHSPKGVQLTWQPVQLPKTYDKTSLPVELVGYHVYRLSRGKFVPKSPITKRPVMTTTYCHKQKGKKLLQQQSYIVRSVIKVGDQEIHGLASQIAVYKAKN